MPMQSDPRPNVSHTAAPLTRWVRGAAAAASALAAVLALAACGVPSLPGRSTPDPGRSESGAVASRPAPRATASHLVPRETALKTLSGLTVAPARSMKGYDRDR